MTVHERKRRERTQRHQLIVSTARELAETQGWDAVTTRRLAERIEYSQPVLYSHFRGKDEIVAAVALEGFTELAAALRRSTSSGGSGREAVAALADAYLAFAERHPAVYDAMFSISAGLEFATETTPAPLRDGFAALRDTLAPLSGDADTDLLTEVFWAALHGLATLTRAGRLPPERTRQRLELLLDHLC